MFELNANKGEKAGAGWKYTQTAMITYRYGDREVVGGGGTWKSLLSLRNFLSQILLADERGILRSRKVSNEKKKSDPDGRRLNMELTTRKRYVFELKSKFIKLDLLPLSL